MMGLILLSLVALPAFAQLQVFTVQGTEERPVSGIVSLGATATGEPLDTLFRVRNTLPTLALLNIGIVGSGYSLQQVPSPPALPGLNSLDFVVRFQTSDPVNNARGVLTINSVSVSMQATATAAVAVTVVNEDGTTSPRVSGQSTVFLPAAIGGQSSRRFVLTNPSAQPLIISAVSVTGASYQFATTVPSTLTLNGNQSRNIDIVFQPAATGVQRGELIIDQRRYPLEGVGSTPQLPRPLLSFARETFLNGKQARIAVKFDAASRADGAGVLRFEFTPSIAGPPDPAVAFPTGARTSIPFIVKTGELQATFSGQPEAFLQVGTTAGTFKFTAEMGGFQTTDTIVIAPAAVTVDSITGVKRMDAVELTLKGFDNSRSTSQMTFTFYDTSGVMVQPGDIRADVSDAFTRYFNSTDVGGAFAMRAVFSASTTTAAIREVQVQIRNSAGTTTTNRLSF
ncbi:MAG: hypothetical protein HY820_40585 [Acidobacteria bacterium]|nr:hypothetical protein [Acidobacteriota bacterium]